MKPAAKLVLTDPGPKIRVVATGCLSLDWALGTGGFPRGHLLEIFGDSGSGKTTLGLEAIASAQREGGVAAFLDAEHALDPVYAARLGVDTERLIYSQPADSPRAFEIIRTLVKTCAVDVIVLDSVAALGPAASGAVSSGYEVLRGSFDYWPFANALLALHALIPKSPCCVILLNQVRTKRDRTGGDGETTPGSPTLRHCASMRIRMDRLRTLTSGAEAVGSRCALQVLKSTIGPRGRRSEFNIPRSGGISREADLVTLGLRSGVISRSAEGLRFREFHLGADARQAFSALCENASARAALRLELYERAGLTPAK